MTQLEQWQEDNNRYLSAAIDWLHAILDRRGDAPTGTGPLPSTQTAVDARLSWWRFGRGTAQTAERTPLLLPASGPAQRNETAAAQAFATMTKIGAEVTPPPALLLLAKRLGLSTFEQNILLLCAAMELDTGMASLCARAQHDPALPYPTFALALMLFDEPAWDCMSPERGLRYWRLIEINQPAGQALTVSPLRADERIVNYLKGVSYLDERLSTLVSHLEPPLKPDEAPPSQRTQAETITSEIKQASGGSLPVVQFAGTDTASKQVVAGLVCGSLNLSAYRLPANLVPQQPAERDNLARLWQRESLLLPVALYLDATSFESETSAGMHSNIDAFLERMAGLTFVDTREPLPALARATLRFDILKPTSREQQVAWSAALGKEAENLPELLTGQFDLSAVAIRRIARASTQGDASSVRERLWDACLQETRPRLGAMAQRIEPKAAWPDLVLPQTELQLLHQIADQVGQRAKVYDDWGFRAKMSRGLGISALFSGPSGTGKTLAAEVLAASLRLNLFRIDLSAVVSKYIGETEKNLRKMFDAAEDGGAILFFDEADALFGKRSEVKDSHDRYANIEINYLLQRMEAYRGLAILATNMKSALDPAFLRRLRFIVTFPFPAAAERKAIWQRAFPAETPTQGLDLDRLAKMAVTGGNIHAIAINAAFVAAQAGVSVTMPLVLTAARTEFRKLSKPINEADFRWTESTGAVA